MYYVHMTISDNIWQYVTWCNIYLYASLASLIQPHSSSGPVMRQVVNRILSDESTILEAKRVLRDALADQELRNSAKAPGGSFGKTRTGASRKNFSIYICIYIYETHMAHILHLFLIGIRCAFGNRCAHPYAYENMGDASNKEMWNNHCAAFTWCKQ